MCFNKNKATFGESIFSYNYSTVTIYKNSFVKFNNNTPKWYGGELYSNENYDVLFDSNGVVTCSTPNTFPICIQKRCTCKDIDSALADLMVNNVSFQLTIDHDVTLHSVLLLKDNEDISIIGHNQPTINCNKVGGLHFTSCSGCTIVGITWNECGAVKSVNDITIPGLKFENSSMISIQNCTFRHSIGQAVVLSEVSGHVKINNCKFMNNNDFKGHGTAIYYSSKMHSQLMFTISNCNFTENIGGTSVVYAEEFERILQHDYFAISNSCFCSNQGTPLYISYVNLNVKEEVLFNGNKAENGSGIYASHSNVTFCSNSITKFNRNLAIDSGGAIYFTNYSNALFEGNSVVEFEDNNATKNGESVCFHKNSKAMFKGSSNI